MFDFPCFNQSEIIKIDEEDIKEFRKKYKKLRFSAFEIEYIKKYANLTKREKRLLDLKNSEEPPSIEQCAEIMDMSVSTVSRTTNTLIYKIIRIL